MARTYSGIEFYLVELVGETADLHEIEPVLRDIVREGDGVFRQEDRLFAALVGEVTGAAQAARRLIRALRARDLPVKVRLVAEPFPPPIGKAAALVITGRVRMLERDSSHQLWMRR